MAHYNCRERWIVEVRLVEQITTPLAEKIFQGDPQVHRVAAFDTRHEAVLIYDYMKSRLRADQELYEAKDRVKGAAA
jgi:hypothetical protein